MTAAAPSQALLGQKFAAARQAFQAGRPADAVALLRPVVEAEPAAAPVQHLLGLCLLAMDDVAGAEAALRASLTTDPSRPPVHFSLAEALNRAGRTDEAEAAFRAALALDPRYLPAVRGLAGFLLAQSRPEAAADLTGALAQEPAAAPVLELHAEVLRRAGRLEESIAALELAVGAGAPTALLDMAAAYRELARYDEAEATARRALRLTGDHPAIWTVLGHALQELGRLQEAEDAFRKALNLAPFDPSAHQALAQLLWARTADPEQAAAPLEAALRQRPGPVLIALKAKMLVRAGKAGDALAMLTEAARRGPEDFLIHASAATAAVHAGQVEAGLDHAERALALRPNAPGVRALLAEAALAAGQPARASEIAAQLLAEQPFDQQYIALQAVAWRLLGDERYRGLYDYETMVRGYTLSPPAGWSSLDGFLGDLATTLKALHGMRGDPLDQSLRKGTQTEQNLALSSDPVIRAFFTALDAPVRDYVAALGAGRDPLRARNAGGYRVKSAWSVRLNPHGFHADHIHPEGWLSSAFYLELPAAVDGEGREGWIKFGEPGMPSRPALGPEHFVKPAPGKLVLFPSYMWHGTVPFSGEEQRLTMAFDIVPARG